MKAPVDTFAQPATLLDIVRTCIEHTGYHLDEISEAVGAKLAPEAWAKLVQEVSKAAAVKVAGAFVLSVIRQEAARLNLEAVLAEAAATEYRARAAALLQDDAALTLF